MASVATATAPAPSVAAAVALQHNLGALQTQLQALQRENSALTKDLCLKENYIQLKEQQVRVMQRRLEELEGAVAGWKDRCMQQLNARQARAQSTSQPSAGVGVADPVDDSSRGEWTPWMPPFSAAQTPDARDKGLKLAAARLDQLSAADRSKLSPLLKLLKEEAGSSAPGADAVFSGVDEELSKLLLIHVLPAFAGADVRCFSRTYSKQAMDLRVVLAPPEPEAAPATVKEDAKTPVVSPTVSPSASPSAGVIQTLEAEEAQDEAEDDGAPPHLFDCVDCDKRNAVPVPHGPRELHPSKAMYVSRPLNGPVAGATTASPRADAFSKVGRRNTFAPSRGGGGPGPTFAIENTRLQSTSALPSPSSLRMSSSSIMVGADGDGDRRSAVAAFVAGPGLGKDSKNKKKGIMGSVMGRLNRHKSQLPSSALTSASSTAFDDDESICDGCGRGPLTGNKWVCRTCHALDGREYELCDKCYGQGGHGKESDPALFARIESIVVRKCPRLGDERELLALLRVGICKANLKKFSFCLTWIADLLQCRQTKDLRARALEISHISPRVRSEFVRLLADLLRRYRRDIELISEWEPVPLASSGAGNDGHAASGGPQLDTLRIWVKDSSDASQQTQQQ